MSAFGFPETEKTAKNTNNNETRETQFPFTDVAANARANARQSKMHHWHWPTTCLRFINRAFYIGAFATQPLTAEGAKDESRDGGEAPSTQLKESRTTRNYPAAKR